MIGNDRHVSFLMKEQKRKKSPGFDGLPYKFYQRFWDQLGPEFTGVLSEAFQPGAAALPADITEGRVTLLYKVKEPDRGSQLATDPSRLVFCFNVFLIFWFWRKLTRPSLPIMSAIRKTETADHRKVSGPQHIL